MIYVNKELKEQHFIKKWVRELDMDYVVLVDILD